MYVNIVITLILLAVTAFFIRKKISFSSNIWLLFVTQPLVMSSAPVIVFIGGILSFEITGDPALATLPITMMVLGVACAAIPASLIAKQKGRKSATFTGLFTALFAAMIAMYSIISSSFETFILASFLFGASNAFVQQLRFAAIESTPNKADIPKVLSLLMLSGLFAAFLGPEVALAAKNLIPSTHEFVGSFFIIALFIVAAMVIMSKFKNTVINETTVTGVARPLSVIIQQPIFIVSILSAVIGYALMSYLMTATPISMHAMHGHDLADTKWVIQSHIAAMFFPSLFTAWLVKKLGLKTLLLIGTLIYSAVTIIAVSGEEVLHYWWALTLLGIGWNFLFLTGTSLLPLSYQDNERHKVQATNDFVLFAFQAISSLLAGWVLYKGGWHLVVLSGIPFVIILFIVTIYFYRNEKELTTKLI